MSAPAPEPRFDLHLEGGEAGLVLVEPLELAEGASLDALEVALGRFEGRMDLRAGAERFRHRRGAVRAARIRSSLHRLEAWAASLGVGLQVSAKGERELGVEFAGVERSLGLEVDGGALILRPSEALTSEMSRAALALGFASTPEGRLRLERPLRPLLIDALASRGWRVPDERGCELRVELSENAVRFALYRPA